MKLRFLAIATALTLAPFGATAQQAQTAAGFDLPDACKSAAQASGHGQMMQGSNMPMMQNMQGMMGSMSDAQKASMDAMMKMNPAMMQGMMVKDPDVAWACSMIPHHLGAIEMSKAVMRHGDNAEIKKMAEKSIKEQEKEVSELMEWVQKHAKKN